jgi:hypothetical protein
VVARITPVLELVAATATQFVEEPQETPVRPVAPDGTVWLVHVAPPLVVAMTTPEPLPLPTATQSDTDAQDTPEKPEAARPAGTV